MIKASQFSLNSGLFQDLITKFAVPKSHEKEKLYFLSGDPTYYGHVDLKMSNQGYEIIKQAIKNPNNHSILSQSEGTFEARCAVAKHFQGYNMQLSASNVILTHGANMGLLNILYSITNRGENILVPEPGYPFYHLTAPSMGVEIRPYKLIPEKSFEIDLEHLQTLVDRKTRFLWIVNPSNPCGSIFSRAHMEKIFEFCEKNKIFIISDEVYWNESFLNYEFISFGHMATEKVPVIVLGGVEKTFLVPGWSVSWMVFFDKTDRLRQIRNAAVQLTDYFEGPCSFMQSALPKLLDTLTPNYTKNFMGLFEDNYNYLYKEFASIPGLTPIKAQGTFYIAVIINLEQFKGFQKDIDFLQSLLTEENVWILNLSAFNGHIHGFRMMTCATQEIYEKLLPRIRDFCDRHIKEVSS
ncbi:hypothetical protein ABPG72_001446 [Tetrahymena utriculariae]